MGTVDDSVVRIAERRLHLVTDDEAQQLGLTSRAIARRLKLGKPAPGGARCAVHSQRTVRRLTARARAVSVGSRGRALALSAAAYWGIRRAPKDRVDVTVPKGSRVSGLQRGRPLQQLDARPSRRRVGRRRPGHVGGPNGLRLGGVLDADGHLSVIEDVRNKGLCSDAELGEVYYDLCGRGRRGSAAWERLADLTDRAARPTMSELELTFPRGAGRGGPAGGRPAAPGRAARTAARCTSISRIPTSPRHRDRPLGVARDGVGRRAGQGPRPRAGAARLGAAALHRNERSNAGCECAWPWSAPCSTSAVTTPARPLREVRGRHLRTVDADDHGVVVCVNSWGYVIGRRDAALRSGGRGSATCCRRGRHTGRSSLAVIAAQLLTETTA